MAVKGPKRPDVPATSAPDASSIPPDAAPASTAPAWAPAEPVAVSPDDRRQQGENEAALLGEGRIGDPTVTAPELMAMGSLVRARHLMTLMARRRRDVERTDVIQEVGDLLLSLEPAEMRRLLFAMGTAGRIVDVYPLEVLAYVLEKKPIPHVSFGSIVQNKRGLEAATFTTEQILRFKIPLAIKLTAFAIEGGPQPGYAFTPGPPGAYHLELDKPGEYPILIQGSQRRSTIIDRLVVRLEEPPDPSS